MKRFYSAIILLLTIIFTSMYINIKTINKAEELLLLTQSNDSNAVIEWWDNNEVFFEALLPGELNNILHNNVLLLKENRNNKSIIDNIRIGAERILESYEFSIENIF